MSFRLTHVLFYNSIQVPFVCVDCDPTYGLHGSHFKSADENGICYSRVPCLRCKVPWAFYDMVDYVPTHTIRSPHYPFHERQENLH